MSSQNHDQEIPAQPQSPSEKVAPAAQPKQPALHTPVAPQPHASVGYSGK